MTRRGLYRMVPSGLCFVLYPHLEPIALSSNCLASRELIVVNVLLSNINVYSSSIAHLHLSRCGLSMACPYVNGSLLMDVDARAFALMLSACAEILT
jgi:hypothetical protein